MLEAVARIKEESTDENGHCMERITIYFLWDIFMTPCVDLDTLIENQKLKQGMTQNCKNTLIFPHDVKKILLVDNRGEITALYKLNQTTSKEFSNES
jgi:hypothetical protein